MFLSLKKKKTGTERNFLNPRKGIYKLSRTKIIRGAFLVAQTIKIPPAKQETWVWSLGWEDPLEKGMARPIPVFLPGELHG